MHTRHQECTTLSHVGSLTVNAVVVGQAQHYEGRVNGQVRVVARTREGAVTALLRRTLIQANVI